MTEAKTRRTRAEYLADCKAKREALAQQRRREHVEKAVRDAEIAKHEREIRRQRICSEIRKFGGDITEAQLERMGRGFRALAGSMVESGRLIRLQGIGDGTRYGLADAGALTA